MTNNNTYTKNEIATTLGEFERIIAAKSYSFTAAEIYTDYIQMIKALPKKQKNVVYYRCILGHTNKQTAQILGILPSAVTNLINRAVDNMVKMAGGDK